MCGSKIAHGTPFKRAGDEGCLDFDRVVQIGLRGTGYGPEDWSYGRDKVLILLLLIFIPRALVALYQEAVKHE